MTIINATTKPISTQKTVGFTGSSSQPKRFMVEPSKSALPRLATVAGSWEIIEQKIDGNDGTAIGHLGTAEVGVIFPNEDQVKAASVKIKEVLGD